MDDRAEFEAWLGIKPCGAAHDLARAAWQAATQRQQERIAALEAQVQALSRDAGRYRQIRRGQKWSVIDGIGDQLRGEPLDAAIDAAIARATHKEQT